MKKLMNIYANWRADVLLCVMAAAMLLLFAESDSLAALLLTKIAAVAALFLFAALFSKWETEGKLTELQNLLKEED